MRASKRLERFDTSTYQGRYRRQTHEYDLGIRKRPPSKKSVNAEFAAEALASAKKAAKKAPVATKKVAAGKKK